MAVIGSGAHAANVRSSPASMPMGNKSSEVVAWARRVERDADRTASALREQAQVVYRGVRAAGKLPQGIDKIMTAKRLRRRLLKAAAGAEQQARAMRSFRHDWLQSFGTPGSREAVQKNGFDLLE